MSEQHIKIKQPSVDSILSISTVRCHLVPSQEDIGACVFMSCKGIKDMQRSLNILGSASFVLL